MANQTPEQIRAEMRREYLITDLRLGIERMADRYADSHADWVIALRTGADDRAAKFKRRRRWQHKALRRLAMALANLAVA